MASNRIAMSLPESIKAEMQDDVAILRLIRPEKRNALDDTIIAGIDAPGSPAGTARQAFHHGLFEIVQVGGTAKGIQIFIFVEQGI